MIVVLRRLLPLALLASLLMGIPVASASAAACPDPKKDGKTIGNVVFGSTVSDIKSVNYPAGGQLDPPKSPDNVGLSARHMPLSSPVGTSVLVWHVNYNGCQGRLNSLAKRGVGAKFTVIDEKGFEQRYVITKSLRVAKGKYKAEWFRMEGARQLSLFTCTGTVIDGHYTQNQVLIAVPVPQV